MNDDVVKNTAKILYGSDDVPLNFERCTEYREFTDSRVQSCWQSEVVGRLQQAIGRARLNRLGNTVVVYSNVLIPGFTGSAVGFVSEDLDVAGDLSSMEKVAAVRIAAERASQELTGEHSITDFQNAFGCSESQARRLWEQAGGGVETPKYDNSDDALRSHILELQTQGLSLRAIEKIIGFSRRKINRILQGGA